MALSCGRRRHKIGGDCGGGGCRHFHVHYHLPRRVCASSFVPNLLPRFFSLLSACVLVPPVLFLAVLAFLVLFVWFTLLYFLRSLWNKDRNGEFFGRSSKHHGSDAGKCLGEGVAEEGKVEKKALKISSEPSIGDSAVAEDCARRFGIEEVYVSSDDSQNLLRMASCLNCEMHTDDEKLIEEVIIFEIERGESEAAIVCSDGLSEKRQLQDMSIDWFEEEIKSGDIIKSGDSSPTLLSTFSSEFHDFCDNNEVVGLATDFLDVNNQNKAVLLDSLSHRGIVDNHCKCGEEFSSDKEAPACHSFENSDFVDKHETREVVLGDTVTVLTLIDDSANDDSEYKEDISEQKDPNNLSGFLDNVADVFYQQQEIHKVVVSDDKKPTEVLFLGGKQIEVADCLANGDNIDEVASLGSSICENVEDKDDKSDDNCISEGASHGNGMPFVKRSPAPWWNLCGVIDVFAGCKD
uniref:Uncharacterized protein n=1 Tax=Oryza punctata TaxID=4537 RepID=A0A0E0L0D8_ORYPU